jgi:hypothetical protein
MQATTATFTCPHCSHKVEVQEVGDGELITCSNPLCRRQFQADIPRATPEPELIVPGAAKEPGADEEPVRAVPIGQPAPAADGQSVTEDLPPDATPAGTTVAAPETPVVVAVHRPVMFRRHPVRFLINVGLIVLGLALLITALARDAHPILAFLSLIPVVLGIMRLVSWWWQTRQTRLTITSRGIVISEGTVSVTTREIHHESIHGIHIFQPWICSVLKTGAMAISYGDKGEEYYFDALAHPHHVAEQIRAQARK